MRHVAKSSMPPEGDPRSGALGPMPPGDGNANPADIGIFELIEEDYETHGRSLLSPGFIALSVHRMGNWRMGVRSATLRAPLTAAYRAAYHSVIALFGIDLPYNMRLGRRVRFEHHGCIVMGAWSVGDDVIIRGPATIGLARPDGHDSPIIGNRVEIGPRACVGGRISVGDDAFVCPNTVLTEDLPAGATALGNPCRRVDLDKILEPTASDAPQPRESSTRST